MKELPASPSKWVMTICSVSAVALLGGMTTYCNESKPSISIEIQIVNRPDYQQNVSDQSPVEVEEKQSEKYQRVRYVDVSWCEQEREIEKYRADRKSETADEGVHCRDGWPQFLTHQRPADDTHNPRNDRQYPIHQRHTAQPKRIEWSIHNKCTFKAKSIQM